MGGLKVIAAAALLALAIVAFIAIEKAIQKGQPPKTDDEREQMDFTIAAVCQVTKERQ